LLTLTEDQQKVLISQFYSTSGIDFSTQAYSYCETIEDYEYKMPFIKMANNLTNNNLKLFTAIWTPPAWMKETGKIVGGGKLKGTFEGRYYKAYPKYYIKFFEEYKKHDITFWGMSVQNEPSFGIMDSAWWPALYFSGNV
jgi:glucosylceramidase